MRPVDRILDRFLRELKLTDRDALILFNLAPLCVRRQIAALGLLHRRVLGLVPESIAALLPMLPSSAPAHRTRLTTHRHSFQLEDPASGCVTEVFRRSVFGYIVVYNRLPQCVVALDSVKKFQAHLSSAVKMCVEHHETSWKSLLSPKDRISDISKFQSKFLF